MPSAGTAAMRDQHKQQAASDPHGAAGDPQRRRSWFERLLLQLDQPFRFAGKLTLAGLIFGLFGSLVGAYAHYATWRDEQKLATYKEDLAHAISTFSETSSTLSAVMNLQQILFFTFAAAVDASEADDQNSFLLKNAKQSYDDYFAARTGLRKDIDSIAGKAEVFLDLPVDESRDLVTVGALLTDPVRSHPYLSASERNTLKRNGFDCGKHLPTPEAIKVGEIIIDWQRAKHHVVTFYFCLEKLHYDIMPIREWALMGKMAETDKARIKEKMQSINDSLDYQLIRFNEFNALSMSKIEQIRLRNRPKGFLCHQLGVRCDN